MPTVVSLPAPAADGADDNSVDKTTIRGSSKKTKTKSNLLDMPMPKPLPPGAATPTPPPPEVKLRRPKMSGPRQHEYHQPGDDWGSLSVDNYDLGEVIGEGTFGQVFKATDKRTNHIVALKKVRQEKEKEGFPLTTVREIKILRQLNEHQNIIKLREIVSDPLDVNDYKRFKVCILIFKK